MHPVDRTRPVVVALAVAVLATACGASTGTSRSLPVNPGATGAAGGDAIAPVYGVSGGQEYLFRTDRPPVAVRAASRTLARAVPAMPNLHVEALPSTEDAAAIFLLLSPATPPYTGQLDPAKRAIFTAFAGDAALGAWLILVIQIGAQGPSAPLNPFAPAAYRWDRAAVETYVRCGIPISGADQCTQAFFAAGDQAILAPFGAGGHGA